MTAPPGAALLFAAGFGTRMGELTRDRPKPLIRVAGKALIDHSIGLVEQAGIGTVVANTHYMADMLADHLRPRGIAISCETPEILETGGGLRAALPLLGTSPVYTLNTDAIWAGPNPLDLLAAAWDPARMDALLMCVARRSALGHTGDGDFNMDEQGRLRRGADFVYGGAQIICTDGLEQIADPVFSLNRLWTMMHERARLFGLVYPGRWCDVGRPEGIALAEGMLQDV